MAMGYVTTEFSEPGTKLQVEILGKLYDAEILGEALYDANGEKNASIEIGTHAGKSILCSLGVTLPEYLPFDQEANMTFMQRDANFEKR